MSIGRGMSRGRRPAADELGRSRLVDGAGAMVDRPVPGLVLLFLVAPAAFLDQFYDRSRLSRSGFYGDLAVARTSFQADDQLLMYHTGDLHQLSRTLRVR